MILILLLVFGAVIIGRLFFLQIENHSFYKALAQGQQKLFTKVIGERGTISVQDKNGNLYKVALNKEWPFLYVSPEQDKFKEADIETISSQLGEILSLDKNSLREKLSRKSLYEVIKTRLTDEELEKVRGLGNKGLYIGKEKGRYYPYERFLSQVIGFVGGEGGGQYGIEEYWEDVLRGKEEIVESKKEPAGYFFFSEPPEAGSDIVLTIDYNLQYQSEKLLSGAEKELNIEGGQIIILDSNTGKIVSLANSPGFDPNEYQKYAKRGDLDVFKNGAVQSIFEPGSVFKPITMASALNEGKITPFTAFTDTGSVKIGGRTIYNYDNRVWGKKTMTEVLERSINTGAVFAQSQISHNTFLNYIEKFGIFELTNVGLPGEVFSQNKELKKGYEINFATASFGQGIEMTPLQLLRAYSAISNEGKLVKPYIVEKIAKEGKIIKTIEGEQSKEGIISEEVSSKLSAMLVSVIENGFAKSAKIDGYYVAGKTGTAQVAWSALGIKKEGYSDKTTQSFIGFFPAFKPKFLVLVKLDNPAARTAEYSALPIFRKLAKYIIDYYQIPPDYE
ncbi:MAG: penicillin-binding protein 2 [Candidatus Nealsonbacteria bacterium]|nr:penicillin-binding protein 2 [Candidatus Nealsonbacteria bacterium]